MKTLIKLPESIICWHCETETISEVDKIYKGDFVIEDSDGFSVRNTTRNTKESDIYVICPNKDCKAICILKGNNLTQEVKDAATYRLRIYIMPD